MYIMYTHTLCTTATEHAGVYACVCYYNKYCAELYVCIYVCVKIALVCRLVVMLIYTVPYCYVYITFL